MSNANVQLGIVFALGMLLGQSSTGPDFSGQWILDSPLPAPADAVSKLTVLQPVTRTNARGEALRSAYLTITIRRERASGVTDETRSIGVAGGAVGGVVGPQAQPSVRSRFETVWREGSLIFLNSQSARDGDWFERREAWSLEPDGRLRVEFVSEGNTQAKQTIVSFYKRAPVAPRSSPRTPPYAFAHGEWPPSSKWRSARSSE